MINLQYGYKKPQDGDTGDSFFPALAANWDRMSTHDHDGINSAPLIAVGTLVPLSFAPFGGEGLYIQELTLPAGRVFDTTQIWFRSSNGNAALLDVEKTATNKFNVITNQPNEQYTVFYR